MNKTVNDLTVQQKNFISSIDGILNKVQSGTSEITADLTQTALILPFSNKFPQLTSYKGTIISPQLDSTVVVQLKGVFNDIPNSGYEAKIIIGNNSFKTVSKSTQEIKFLIPASLFKTSSNKVDYIPFDIDINYKKEYLFFFGSKEVAKFNLFFVVLPETFGSFALETTELVDSIIYEDKICPNLTWNTHNGNDDGTIKGCPMEGGWTCDVISVHPINFRGEEGSMNVDWFDRGSVSAPNYAGWNYLATTKHGPFGNYGGLTIDLAYKRFKNTQVLETKVTPQGILHWGDKKVLTIAPTSQWKLTFTQFDGKIIEIASSKQISPYFNVRSVSNQIEIDLAPWSL